MAISENISQTISAEETTDRVVAAAADADMRQTITGMTAIAEALEMIVVLKAAEPLKADDEVDEIVGGLIKAAKLLGEEAMRRF